MSETKKGYAQEFLEQSNTTDHAISLLKEAGELVKPYESECLGTISFHFFAKPNVMTGQIEVGFITCSTEINVKAEILNGMLEALRDTMLKVVGGELKTLAPPKQGELEEARRKSQEILS